MRRIQVLPEASEVCFVDSTSACDDMHHSVTLMLCATDFGALPLAVLLTDSQSQVAYTAAFQLFKETNGGLCFGQKASPSIFMTDDSFTEREALKV